MSDNNQSLNEYYQQLVDILGSSLPNLTVENVRNYVDDFFRNRDLDNVTADDITNYIIERSSRQLVLSTSASAQVVPSAPPLPSAPPHETSSRSTQTPAAPSAPPLAVPGPPKGPPPADTGPPPLPSAPPLPQNETMIDREELERLRREREVAEQQIENAKTEGREPTDEERIAVGAAIRRELFYSRGQSLGEVEEPAGEKKRENPNLIETKRMTRRVASPAMDLMFFYFEKFHDMTQKEQKSALDRMFGGVKRIKESMVARDWFSSWFNTAMKRASRDQIKIMNIEILPDEVIFSPLCPDEGSRRALEVFYHLMKKEGYQILDQNVGKHMRLTEKVVIHYKGVAESKQSYGFGMKKQFDTHLLKVFEYGMKNKIPFAVENGEQYFYNAVTELLLTTYIRESFKKENTSVSSQDRGVSLVRLKNLQTLNVPIKLLFPYLINFYLDKKRSGQLTEGGGLFRDEEFLIYIREYIGLTDEYLYKQVETDEEKISKLEEEIKAVKQMKKSPQKRLKLAKLKQKRKELRNKIENSAAGETKNIRQPRFEMISNIEIEINGVKTIKQINDYDGMTYEEYIDYFTIFMLFDLIDNNDGFCVKLKDYKDEEKDQMFCPYGGWLKGETSRLKYFNVDFLKRFINSNLMCAHELLNFYFFVYEDVEYSADEIINRIDINYGSQGIRVPFNERRMLRIIIRNNLRRLMNFDLDGLSEELKNEIVVRFKNSKYLKRKFLEYWTGSVTLPPEGVRNSRLQMLIEVHEVDMRQMEGETFARYQRRLENTAASKVLSCFNNYKLRITPELKTKILGRREREVSLVEREAGERYEAFIEKIMVTLLSDVRVNTAGGGYDLSLRGRRRTTKRKRKRKKASTKKKNKNKRKNKKSAKTKRKKRSTKKK